MRVLALDIGKVRTGIAVSDPQGRVATPVCVLSTSDIVDNTTAWQRVLQDWEPELLLAGLPQSLSGKVGAQAQRTKDLAQSIAQRSVLPIEYTDERLSSAEAKRSLHESGLSEREMRGKVDMIAASLFLQAWLDEQQAATKSNASVQTKQTE
ncbi:MAG: Holliday junction resolvase RuvX [Eggerthellaceae bacterium]|nr:Holliday junction resolvase RuvX [Eggerthellaceae bacterium]